MYQIFLKNDFQLNPKRKGEGPPTFLKCIHKKASHSVPSFMAIHLIVIAIVLSSLTLLPLWYTEVKTQVHVTSLYVYGIVDRGYCQKSANVTEMTCKGWKCLRLTVWVIVPWVSVLEEQQRNFHQCSYRCLISFKHLFKHLLSLPFYDCCPVLSHSTVNIIWQTVTAGVLVNDSHFLQADHRFQFATSAYHLFQ